MQDSGFKIQNSSRRAFTLIELVTSMSLFLIIVSVAVGGFVRNLHAQRQTAAFINANANASNALEQMAREIRTGECFEQTSSGNLTFTNANGERVTYIHNAGSQTLERAGQSIVAQDVLVTNAEFLLNYENPEVSGSCLLMNDPSLPGYPPRVTIILQISPDNIQGFESPIVNLQTTVSARTLKYLQN